MTLLNDTRYWWYALVLGSLIQAGLFGSFPFLGMKPDPEETTDYVVVDFMQWQPPTPKPTETPPPQDIPAPAKVAKPEQPKQILENKEIAETKPEQDIPVLTDQAHDSGQATAEPKAINELPVPQPLASNAAVVDNNTAEELPKPVPLFKLSAMPRYAHEAPGSYPLDMRALGIEAVVQVEILLDATGKIRKITITESAGTAFDEAALEKIRLSTFLPGHIDGKPVPVLLREKVRFDLR